MFPSSLAAYDRAACVNSPSGYHARDIPYWSVWDNYRKSPYGKQGLFWRALNLAKKDGFALAAAGGILLNCKEV